MRLTKIVKHLTDEELKIRYESASDPKIKKRWHMLWLVQAKGYKGIEASRIVGQNESWASYWIKQYNQRRSSAIVMPKLRNPKLAEQVVTEEMKAELLDKLSEMVPNEIGRGLWSGPKVSAFIEAAFGKKISRKKGWELLKECGYSITTVRAKHRKTPDFVKEGFKKNVT